MQCWLTFLNKDVVGEIISHLSYLSWCQLKDTNKEHFTLLSNENYKNKIPEKSSLFKTIDSLSCDYTEEGAYELLYYSNGKILKNNWIWIATHFSSFPDYINILWVLFGSQSRQKDTHVREPSESFLGYFVRVISSTYYRNTIKFLVKNNKTHLLDTYGSGGSLLNYLIMYSLKYRKMNLLEKHNYVKYLFSIPYDKFDYYLASYDNPEEMKNNYRFFSKDYSLSYYEGLVHYNKVNTIYSLLSDSASPIIHTILSKAIKENKILIIEEMMKRDPNVISLIRGNATNWYAYCQDEIMVKFLIKIGIKWTSSIDTYDLIVKTNRKYPQSKSIQYSKYLTNIDVWCCIKPMVPYSLSVLEKIVMMLGKRSSSPPLYFSRRLKNFSDEEKVILQKYYIVNTI